MFSKTLTAALTSLAWVAILHSPARAQRNTSGPDVGYPLEFKVSGPVRNLPPQARKGPAKEIPVHRPPGRPRAGNVVDPVVQSSTPAPPAAQGLQGWEGLGVGFPGYSITGVPPDPNLAIGPNHAVQWVNNSFIVFNKQGTALMAPVADSDFWGALSTCYQLGGFSDPIVQYDRAADRWLVGEVALPLFPGLFGQYAQCFAVSTSPDPMGSYNLWAYGFGNDINDYPKIGIWPDGYYVTFNMFQNGTTFSGPRACSFDRNAMLNGVAAPARVCFQLPASFDSLLPSDLDSSLPPPGGSPNFLMNVDTAAGGLNLWRFHVDYVTPNNSTFTGPIQIAGVAPFNAPCLTTQDCISQPGTTQKLDALGDRLMYRLAYRNFGDHESLVANHTITPTGGNTGLRWYEVRNPNGTPLLYQQGSFAPDSDSRWMGSAAMDRSGNIGIGYSVASATTYPSIRYTGWQTGDPFGVLRAETTLVAGGGAQTAYNRWGDYSAMRIDPVDGCTFWYTQEYQATTQTAGWNTRIGSFKFPSCGQSSGSVPTTTALGSQPNPSTYQQPVTFTATVTPSSGSTVPTGSVVFRVDGVDQSASTLSGGVAAITMSTLATGQHSVAATYSGDANYVGSTSPTLTQNVNPASAAIALASSLNPSNFGQTVTFTATLTPLQATGTVKFFDGGLLLGTVNVSAGKATLATSALSAASHSITAQYNGDANFGAVTSAPLTQVVNKANTTTGLTSSANPSNSGQAVTFTATVSIAAATGSVTFFDGAQPLGTVAISNARAALTTSSLGVGKHSITAKYSGDTNCNASTSAALSQNVKRH